MCIRSIQLLHSNSSLTDNLHSRNDFLCQIARIRFEVTDLFDLFWGEFSNGGEIRYFCITYTGWCWRTGLTSAWTDSFVWWWCGAFIVREDYAASSGHLQRSNNKINACCNQLNIPSQLKPGLYRNPWLPVPLRIWPYFCGGTSSSRHGESEQRQGSKLSNSTDDREMHIIGWQRNRGIELVLPSNSSNSTRNSISSMVSRR